MPAYVTLFKFTDQGIRTVKDSPARLEAVTKSIEASGGKVLCAYYTLGEYDVVTITEMPDEATGVASILSVGMKGNVRTTTLRAYTPAEFGEILTKVP